MIAGTRVTEGDAPIRVEPVRATHHASRASGNRPSTSLDQGGMRTGTTDPREQDRTVTLEGAKHRTIYYEVTF